LSLDTTGLSDGIHAARIAIIPAGWTGASSPGGSLSLQVTVETPETGQDNGASGVQFSDGTVVTLYGATGSGSTVQSLSSAAPTAAPNRIALPNESLVHDLATTWQYSSATLSVPFESRAIPAGSQPVLVRVDGSIAVQVPSRVDYGSALLTADVERLGTYVVGITQITGCHFSTSSESLNVAAIGGTMTVIVSTDDPTCAWTAISAAAFISVFNEGTSRFGSGTVSATIAANPGGGRAAVIEIAGNLFTVIQDAAIAPAMITTQPLNQTILAGQTAQFTVGASGNPTPSYQWQVSTNGGVAWSNLVNGSTYSGGTTTTLTVSGATTGMNGTEYRCVATNSSGSAPSGAAVLRVVASIAPGDFDGDGKSDITMYRPSSNTWYVLRSSTSFSTYGSYAWGLTGDIPVRGDFDGDGKEDVAVYRPSNGAWYILQSSTNYTTYVSYLWCLAGDTPETGDYDGDGRTDITVYRPSNGTWYILQSSSGYTTYVSYQWGLTGDVPVPGDYDGDGKTDIAMYRPSNGAWYVLQSFTKYTTYVSYLWGLGGDVPVQADYDGDGKADIAVYRPSNGGWYFLRSSTNYTTYGAYLWGLTGDIPVPADFDGDGKTDIAVYRPSNGGWYFLQSSTGYSTYVSYLWGLAGDVPLLKRP